MPTKSKTPAPVTTNQSVSEAFATILRHNFAYLLQWEEAARSWEDIEGVHQFRVTVRRMRSALSLFRDAIPKAAGGHWSAEMRWIAGELSLARDLDVFISDGLSSVADELPLRGCQGLLQLAEERRLHRECRYMQRPRLANTFEIAFNKGSSANSWCCQTRFSVRFQVRFKAGNRIQHRVRRYL